jgi:7-cyano-7-deazaguanine synthase
MALITLVSGGLDSTVMALLAHKKGLRQLPLFIDYGQRSRNREWAACLAAFRKLKLPEPASMDLNGFGKLISSGLTRRTLRVNEDAFLPGRNLLFLLAGCAYASEKSADGVAIGLLTERNRIFPDQTEEFLRKTEALIQSVLFRQVKIVAPLIAFSKIEIVAMAQDLGVTGTYSCHSGAKTPCGVCISCLETSGAK